MSLKPRRATPLSNCVAVLPSPHRQCISPSFPRSPNQQRCLHASPSHKRQTVLRREMLEWFRGHGKMFKSPLPGSTNYLSAYDRQGNLTRQKRRTRSPTTDGEDDEGALTGGEGDANADTGLLPEALKDLRPFPQNRYFHSQSVLSEEMREEIYEMVAVQKLDVSSVSAAYGIDMRRVAAVVRLKTIEKQWQAEGKPLARPYNNAVLDMLPQTPYRSPEGKIVNHESINDLPVHPATRNQIFYSASESRKFTRDDAAKAFSPGLLPADARIPHPEMIEIEKWTLEGMSKEERLKRLREKETQKREEQATQEAKRRGWEERTQRVVAGRRWDFKFQDVSVEDAGRDGRGRNGVGLRYGYAHTDRKKGSIKIPTSVE